jgi:hypothetical protein
MLEIWCIKCKAARSYADSRMKLKISCFKKTGAAREAARQLRESCEELRESCDMRKITSRTCQVAYVQ